MYWGFMYEAGSSISANMPKHARCAVNLDIVMTNAKLIFNKKDLRINLPNDLTLENSCSQIAGKTLRYISGLHYNLQMIFDIAVFKTSHLESVTLIRRHVCLAFLQISMCGSCQILHCWHKFTRAFVVNRS